jgi:hypothetical protein
VIDLPAGFAATERESAVPGIVRAGVDTEFQDKL